MAQWLFFVAEYNFEVKYKTGKRNVLNKALSRRPGYELAHVTTLSSPIEELIRVAYRWDSQSVACFMPLVVRNISTWTLNYRRACVPAYIDITSIVASCGIARMLLASSCLTIRT